MERLGGGGDPPRGCHPRKADGIFETGTSEPPGAFCTREFPVNRVSGFRQDPRGLRAHIGMCAARFQHEGRIGLAALETC